MSASNSFLSLLVRFNFSKAFTEFIENPLDISDFNYEKIKNNFLNLDITSLDNISSHELVSIASNIVEFNCKCFAKVVFFL